MKIIKKCCLIGPPNSGKTALFNALTGHHYKSTNYPGVTVECRQGIIQNSATTTSTNDLEIHLIDLPGLYSFDATGFDEKITRDYLLHYPNKLLPKLEIETQYDLVLLVIDATRLEKSLYLAEELRALKIPFILILNMTDIAQKREQLLNIKLWQELWQIAIFEISSITLIGMAELKTSLFQQTWPSSCSVTIPKKELEKLFSPTFIAQAFSAIEKLLKKIQIKKIKPDSFSQKLDLYLLHPFWGPLALIMIMTGLFQLLFSASAPLQDGISWCFDQLDLQIRTLIPTGVLSDFITHGILLGLSSILVFLPQIFFLSLFIIMLEDSGYLARVAYLLDGIMKRLALPGKAIVPLLSSHACAIPGIMSARTLDKEQDRLTTMAIAPLTTCSARIPVYTLLIAALIPAQKKVGFISVQALSMFSLYMLGILMGFIVAYILKKKIFKTTVNHMLLELPSYRMPSWKNIKHQTLQRVATFIKKAGTIILGLSLVLWFLTYFPRIDDHQSAQQLEQSYAAKIGKFIRPIFAPLGFDWEMTTALIPSFAAREVMVSSLATINAVNMDDENLGIQQLQKKLSEKYPIDTLLALLMWFVFAPQCFSTFAVLYRETHGYKWPIIVFSYTLFLAYASALLVKVIF